MERRIALVVPDEELKSRVARCFDHAPANWRVAFFDVAPPDADVTVSTSSPADVTIDPDRVGDIVGRVAGFLKGSCSDRVIVVEGATGGCGTTTVALHLARALARWVETGLVEADPARRSCAFRLGLGDDARTWAADDDSFEGLPAHGFRLFPAPAGGECVPSASALRGDLEVVVREPGASPDAAAGVLVVPPTPAGVRRAAALIPSLPDVPWAVVLNRTAPGEVLRTHTCTEVMGVEPTLALPFSASVRRSELGSTLATRWCRFSLAVDRLARSILAAT